MSKPDQVEEALKNERGGCDAHDRMSIPTFCRICAYYVLAAEVRRLRAVGSRDVPPNTTTINRYGNSALRPTPWFEDDGKEAA